MITTEPIDGAVWASLSEAETATGIRRDALYQRIKTKAIPEDDWIRGTEDKAPFFIRRSILSTLEPAQYPKAPRKAYTRKDKEAVDQPGGPQPPKDELTVQLREQISYAAGHTQGWLETYAITSGVPLKQLMSGVVGVLRSGI